MNLFTDKVVVITGAGSGIGCQAAINFAKNGANLVLNDINDSRLGVVTKNIKSFNTAIVAAPGDIANSTECSKLVELALEKLYAFGQIHLQSVSHLY